MNFEDNISVGLELLEKQVLKLLERINFLENELSAHQKENEQLKEELKNSRLTINNFQNQTKISKIVGHVAVKSNAAELKGKINTYIKEIDKCIAHLNSQ